MIRVTTAWPVAKRHRRRRAALAREDTPPIVGNEQTQVEHIGLELRAVEHFAHQSSEPKSLRDLAGTTAIVAGRTDDQEYARLGCRILSFVVRLLQPRAGREPLYRQLVVGISKFLTGLL